MLDFRKKACPEPVIKTKEFINNNAPESLQIIVDNQPAVNNLTRLLSSLGYTGEAKAQGNDFILSAVRNPEAAKKTGEVMQVESIGCEAPAASKICVLISSNLVGRGDDVLGAGLMKNYLATLNEMGPDLWRLIFLNSGVKLCCKGSESLDTLCALHESGVSILACGTCLNHFNLLDQKMIGETTNMLDIVTSLQLADSVITI